MTLFVKSPENPVFGGPRLGTCFDVYVAKVGAALRMDFSWRREHSLAVTSGTDGVRWAEPRITLRPAPENGWEDDVNRNCVLFEDGIWRMWYTGQARGHSAIGYAESEDGLAFRRIAAEPVLWPEADFEGASVMNPCVLREGSLWRMWYSAGETYEPNVLCYAESMDGIRWRKYGRNPIFTCAPEHPYERDRVGGCQIVSTEDMGYVQFYIGYADIDTAHICCAASANGVDGWVRSEANPLISPDSNAWDADACYKPSALWDDARHCWRLWYNGRRGAEEYIGLAEKSGRDLFGTL